MEPDILLLEEGETAPPTHNVRSVVGILFRRRRVMLITFLAILLGFAIAKITHHRTYSAEMKILVNRSRVDPIVSSSSSEQLLREGVDEAEINSEVQLLKTRDLLKEVVTNLHLEAKAGKLDQATRVESAVDNIASGLSVEPVKKTNLIAVRFRSGDPEGSVRVLKAISELYLQKHTSVRRPQGQVEFFQKQADQYQQALAQAEADVSAFSQQQGTSAPQLERDQALENLKESNAALQQTNAAIEETQKRLATLKVQAGGTPQRQVTQARTSENPLLIQQLRSTLLALELKKTSLLQTYQPNYPPVVELEEQIKQTKSALESAEKNPVREETTDRDPTYLWITAERAKGEADLSALRAKAAATSATVRQYRAAAEDLNQKAIQQSDLLRNVKTQEENYLLYKHKVEEARISEALDRSGIVNVAVADPPTRPVFPDPEPWLNPFVGLFVATLASLLSALIAEYLDPSFRSPAELQRVLQLPVLAAIPARAQLTTGSTLFQNEARSVHP